MKKVITKKGFLSTIIMLSAFCMLAPQVQADPVALPGSIQSIINGAEGQAGRNIRHDTNNLLFENRHRDLNADYDAYSERVRGTDGQNTVIQGSPASTDVIQATVEELETKGVYVNTIQVAASEILTRQEIEPILSKYAGRNLFISDIQKMIDEINDLYAQKGFVTAKAYLPEQQVENGSIYVDLIESRIGQVTVNNNRWTKSKYISDRIPQQEGQLFDIVKLEADVLDFNRYNEGVNLSANLKAGAKPGTTDIELTAKENFPFHIMGVMDNMGRKSTGSLRGGPMIVADSLFGKRDRMAVGSYFSHGAVSPFFDYNIPVNKRDGRVGFGYSSTMATVMHGDYAPWGLKSRAHMFSLYYTQPLKRTPGFELKAYGSLNYKYSQTTADIFKLFGVSDLLRRDEVTSIDLGLNMRKDTARGIWYANQGVSYAAPLFDDDSNYFKFNGGVMRIHDLSHGVIAQLRANYQVIPNSKDIPYLDQFMAGGLLTVRGYSEGTLIGKNGYFTSAELMFPLLPREITSPRSGEKIPFIGKYIKGAVFLDHAGVFPQTRYDAYDGSYFLFSAGAGLRIQLPADLTARLYWGFPIVNNAYEYDKKYGRFHFDLVLEPNIDKLLKNRSVAAKVVPQVHKEVQSDYINNYDDVRHYDYFLDGGAAL